MRGLIGGKRDGGGLGKKEGDLRESDYLIEDWPYYM
jgi:hypothetical protein